MNIPTKRAFGEISSDLGSLSTDKRTRVDPESLKSVERDHPASALDDNQSSANEAAFGFQILVPGVSPEIE